MEHGAQIVLVHGVDEHLERAERLGLVLDERVALAEAAQADALLEIVHLLQVPHPTGVDDAQHDLAIELLHELVAQALGLGVVGLLHEREDLVAQLGVRGVLEGGRVRTAGELDDPLVQALEVALALVRVDRAERRRARPDGR